MDGVLRYSRTFTVAVDEVDFRESIKIGAVMQYFQDVATAHASLIGIGYDEMKAQSLCWILTKLSYKIHRRPLLDECLTVTTYPKKPGRVEAVRDFYITDEGGAVVISGVTKWCVVDFLQRTIKRCDTVFKFTDSDYRVDSPFENACPKLESRDTEGAQRQIVDRVRITDLDRNMHVNNARYGDYILNAFSMSELESRQVQSVDFNFIGELREGDVFTVCRRDDAGESFFEAESGGRAVFRARIGWTQ